MVCWARSRAWPGVSLNVVGQVILPANGDVSGPIVYPSLVRNTLGLQTSQWTGRGIGVAVVDSGLEMSSEFRYRVTAFYDFTKGGVDAVPAYDDYGHGTHVASLIGGSGALSSNSANKGLAPNVRFTILKALDKNGAGYTSDVIRAIDFAVDNRVALGIHIINLSLGHPIAQPAAADPLVQAVERASRAGLVVVVAAGNMGINPATDKPGYAGITSPGNAPSAITVGAAKTLDTVSRNDDRIPDYSSSGPTWYDALAKPDVLAPGHNLVAAAAKQGTIYSAYPKLRDADSDYIRLSGTSMATAVTSGVDRADARGAAGGWHRRRDDEPQRREGRAALHGARHQERPGRRVRPSAKGRGIDEREGRHRSRKDHRHVARASRSVD